MYVNNNPLERLQKCLSQKKSFLRRCAVINLMNVSCVSTTLIMKVVRHNKKYGLN